MAELPRDFSFHREGRPLACWLEDLVCEDPSARLAAGEAIHAMLSAVPSIHTDLAELQPIIPEEIRSHKARFKQVIRDTVASTNFAGSEFVCRLVRRKITLHEDWMRRVDADHERTHAPNDREERLLQLIHNSATDEERSRALSRYLRWSRARMGRHMRPEHSFFTSAESMTSSGFMVRIVFDALDVALLADRTGLRVLLAERAHRGEALQALARIGPAAIEFAPTLLDELDTATDLHFYDAAEALGSIGRGHRAVIDALLGRLRSGPIPVRARAARALSHAGPPLAGRADAAIDLLLGATYNPELVLSALPALASIGRDREVALARVLEILAPRPPRWGAMESTHDDPYDATMVERGVALDAVHHFQRFAEQVVSSLIEAFDTFFEYDSDWDYHGEHARVCSALEAFGPLAAPAVPRLVRYLEDWAGCPEDDREAWPRGILDLLTAMGPVARTVLPTLERLGATPWPDDGPPPELDPDEALDRVVLAIRRFHQDA
jgi:hypothetical protein